MKKYRYLIGTGVVLAALAPLLTHAAANTWTGAGSSDWDTATANWTSPTTWTQGDDAIFNLTGAGQVSLGESILVSNMTFNAVGYTIHGQGRYLTNYVVTANASNNLEATLTGPQSLTFQGTGTTVLLGDQIQQYGNDYTGDTYIHGGTVVLNGGAAVATAGYPFLTLDGNATAMISSLASLDSGAVLQMAFLSPTPGGPVVDLNGNVLPYNRPGASLHMTGGTLDLNGWRRNGPGGKMPCPDGSGLIVNSNAWLQSSIVVYGDGTNHTFSGQINDGGPSGTMSPAPFSDKAYQMGILDLHYGTGGYELTLSGANTFSGSLRLGNASVKMSGAGTLGIPSTIPGWTGPLRIYGGNHLDLNGTSQTVGALGSSGTGGNCYNTAVGTVSTLRGGCYGTDSFDCGWNIIDNPGTGGIMALTC